MSKAHDFLFAVHHATHNLLGTLRVADFEQHTHHLLIGTAVKWAFERANGRHNR